MWLDNFWLAVPLSEESLDALNKACLTFMSSDSETKRLLFINGNFFWWLLSSIVLFQAMMESLLTFCILNSKDIEMKIVEKRKFKRKRNKKFTFIDKIECFVDKESESEKSYFRAYKQIYALRNCICHSSGSRDLEKIENIDFQELLKNYKNAWFMYLTMLKKIGKEPSPEKFDDNWSYLIQRHKWIVGMFNEFKF